MEKPDQRIIEFIGKHHVLTLATTYEGQPWCTSCFYAYLEDENVLLFSSDEDTRHISEAIANPKVAGSIVLETEAIGKIQGLQFEGVLIRTQAESFGKYKLRYLKRFPYAVINNSPLWVLEVTSLKFTDNRLGFGKKLFWNKLAGTQKTV